MDPSTFWEDSSSNIQNVKYESSVEGASLACKEEHSLFRYCEGNLNFSTAANSEEEDYGFCKKKISRDPMSHRIIEKRRRDRMNNCLADLSRLIPAEYLKKGRGRIEKTEIIEMAIKHMKHLQTHQIAGCEQPSQEDAPEHPHPDRGPIVIEHYRLGYQECLSETMHFMVEVEGFFAGDPLCVQLINHLQKHCDKILKDDKHIIRQQWWEHSPGSIRSQHGLSWLQRVRPLKDSGIGGSSGIQPVSVITQGMDYEESIMNLSGPSQLREMLTSPKLSTGHVPETIPDHSSNASLYKFKNNIKQRFSAEHCVEKHSKNNGNSFSTVSTNYELVVKRKRYSSDMNNDNEELMMKRRDSDTCSMSSSPPPLPTQYSQIASPALSRPATTPSYGIPIFALDYKGSYYVPLTLDADVLAPYLGALGFGPNANPDSSSSIVLHPVTISVNFHQANHQRIMQNIQPRQRHLNSLCAPMSAWKTESNEFVPLAKWSACASERS
uniref:Uncharacterized protein n=1 Tax=Timema tahoe TaxID=61484 RepID=A0A7R9FKK6_9NEOP|nr:unnamed protein product [Timema tahoe]